MGTHQPQPVPAPPHCESWLATHGFCVRTNATSLRWLTRKHRQT